MIALFSNLSLLRLMPTLPEKQIIKYK